MSYQDENPREELYRRFLDSLKEPASERFFDEDELVEIFDYAGDLEDDYARAEVLFCGARLYPESIPLKERRALLYFDLEDAEKELKDGSAAAYVADNADHTSILFDIVRLQANRPADAPAALDFLMAQYPALSDEETIRFVDLAFDLDQYPWVIANMPKLREKTAFLPSLLYEVMQEADEKSDYETMAAMADELIEAEPFSTAYWAMLFKAQTRLGREDDARQTFDTARALGADNPGAILSLADTIYTGAPYLLREAIAMVEPLMQKNPDEFTFTDCYCALAVQNGENAKAMKCIREYVESHPREFRPLRQLLTCNIPDAEIFFESYLLANNATEPTEAEYDELLNTLLSRGAMSSLTGVLSAIAAHRTLNIPEHSALVEALFANQKYKEIIALAETGDFASEIVQIPVRGAAYIYILVVSYMKTGNGDKATALLEKSLPVLESQMREVPLPFRMGIRTVMTLADKVRQHPASDKLYWEYFDMLSMSKF